MGLHEENEIATWHKSATKRMRLKANTAIKKTDRDSLGHFKPGMANQLRYKTKKKLSVAVDDYFRQVARDGDVPTMTALALFLGVSRKTLHNYVGRYSDILEMAKARVEASLEQRLVSGKGSTQGVMFSLKQMGWTDKQEIISENKNLTLTGFTLVDPNKDEHTN